MKLHNARPARVVEHLESHLYEDLEIEKLLALCHYSRYHFHHMFRAYYGEGVYAMRKRLLLEKSVRQLAYAKSSVTDIAFACGYENQASFNKAFKKQFLCTPSHVRQHLTVPIVPALSSAKLTCFEDMKMQVTVIQRQATNVIYARGEGDYATAAGQAWGQLMPFLYGNRLMQAEVKTMGISHDDPNITQPENIRYDACAALETQLPLPDGLGQKQIAGGNYAMLLHVGAYEGLSETYGYALTEWLPSSGYELRDAPYFEVYRNRDPRRTKPENLRTEVYIPVQK